MLIKQIADLQRASAEEISEAAGTVTVLDDLYAFQRWLQEAKEQIEVNFLLGGEERANGIHPSSISKVGGCELAWLWELTGEVEKKEKYDPHSQNIFDLGTAMHNVLQTHFHAMYGDQFESEVPLVIPELHVTSHADGLFDFSGIRFILEIKTIKEGGSRGWTTVQTSPMEDHRRQATLYMKAAGVPFALILYFNKNTSRMKEHVITFDEEVWQGLLGDIEKVLAASNGEGHITPRPGYGCRWCGYQWTCEHGRQGNGKSSRRAWGRASR
jgi:hypothetical protein